MRGWGSGREITALMGSILTARSGHGRGSGFPSPGSHHRCVCSEAVDTYSPAEIVEHLAALRAEHRLLDEQITRMAANGEDELEAKRLKRRKLQLKDCIARLESLQIPDEPA